MQIELTEEVIQQLVVDTIIKTKVTEALQRNLEACTNDAKIRDAVNAGITQIVTEMVRDVLFSDEELRARIKEKVVEHVTDQFIIGVLDKIDRTLRW